MLPLKWSLFYCMTKSEWQDFRDRVKSLNPAWQRCSCPKKCRANVCDEVWDYDRRRHTKIFRHAHFICQGCHWLKSPAFRIKTWLGEIRGEGPAPGKIPHIIRCLGWTPEQVKELARSDLQRFFFDEEEKRVAVSSDLSKDIAVVRAWDIDLTRLGDYGYSREFILSLEMRMQLDALMRVDGVG